MACWLYIICPNLILAFSVATVGILLHNIIKLYQSQNCTGLLHRKLNFGQNILHCVISLLRSYVGKLVISIHIILVLYIILYSILYIYIQRNQITNLYINSIKNLLSDWLGWRRLVLVLCDVTFCINISISKIPVLIYPMFPMFPNSIMERRK